jgi:hypothetical protein
LRVSVYFETNPLYVNHFPIAIDPSKVKVINEPKCIADGLASDIIDDDSCFEWHSRDKERVHWLLMNKKDMGLMINRTVEIVKDFTADNKSKNIQARS